MNFRNAIELLKAERTRLMNLGYKQEEAAHKAMSKYLRENNHAS